MRIPRVAFSVLALSVLACSVSLTSPTPTALPTLALSATHAPAATAAPQATPTRRPTASPTTNPAEAEVEDLQCLRLAWRWRTFRSGATQLHNQRSPKELLDLVPHRGRRIASRLRHWGRYLLGGRVGDIQLVEHRMRLLCPPQRRRRTGGYFVAQTPMAFPGYSGGSPAPNTSSTSCARPHTTTTPVRVPARKSGRSISWPSRRARRSASW